MTDDTARFDVVGHLDALRRYARSLTRDPHAAEDLVQDALVRAYERRRQFHPSRNLKLWLMSLMHNRFVDRVRAQRSETRLKLAGPGPAEAEAPGQEHSLRLAQVAQAFGALPDDQRAALHLVAVEGLSYQEAAAALSIPLGTLMSRIARGRAALRGFEDGAPAATSVGAPPRRPGASPTLRIVGGRDD